MPLYPPSLGELQVIRLAPNFSESLAQAVASRAFLDAAQVVKEDQRTSVLRGTLDRVSPPIDVFVKTISLSGRAGALRRLLRLTPAESQWRGLDLLRRRGFAAAEPLALFQARDDHGELVEVLVTRRVAGKTLLQHMHDHDLSVRAEHETARAAGALIAAMRSRRIRNRDFKPSNLIVESIDASGSPPAPGNPLSPWERVARPRAGRGTPHAPTSAFRLVQIDASGIRRGHSFSNTMDMLASLLIEPTGCNCPPRLTLRLRAFLAAMPTHRGGKPLGPTLRRMTWHAIDRMIRDHGDPQPSVDPLRR